MRIPVLYTLVAALILAFVIVVIGVLIIDPNYPLIIEAGFEQDIITPNADGENDVAIFSYELARNATISITITDEDSGDTYTFRSPQTNPAGLYNVAFSGVVSGYTLPDENFEGQIERRLIPEGDYTWTLNAEGLDREESDTATGNISIRDADADLPLLTDFNISPRTFTPNQDGVADIVSINVLLSKDAEVTAYLVGESGERIFIAPREELRRDGEAGRQEFLYEGGVDLGLDPPPDGTYTVYIEAQDAVGQRVVLTDTLTIEDGGKPRAGIVPQSAGVDVVMTTAPYDESYASNMEQIGASVPMPDDPDDFRLTQVTVPLGNLLVFMVTVENYGSSPIRTTGPAPGTVYDQRQIAASLGELQQDGAWRVGIQCETSEESYPWRWAIGTEDELITEQDPTNDNVYYYLPPGERSIVWGAIRMTDIIQTANPQQCWAGLIHEGVNVYDNRIGVRDVLIADTTQE